MANLNKVMLIGRLTRDPEAIMAKGTQAGAKFGFAVNNRKLNQDSQQWEEVPVFIDMEIWNRGESKQADRVFCGHTHLAMQSTRDGVEYYNSGSWTDKSATYVTVSEEGVRIHEFGQRPDHRDSGEERGAADTQAAGSALSAGLPANREYASAGR